MPEATLSALTAQSSMNARLNIRLGAFVIFSNLRPESLLRHTANGKYPRFQDIV
jgi:hypothetical protein